MENLQSQTNISLTTFISKPTAQMLLIVIIGFIVYSNTLNAQFTFDDSMHFLNNVLTQDLKYFVNPALVDNSGMSTHMQTAFRSRYVTYFTFYLNYSIGGENVFGYHIFNIIVHLSNALLIYWLLSLLLKTPYFISSVAEKKKIGFPIIALFTALLFVSHPIETQAITYISQRFASLCTLFYLLTIVLYIKSRLALSRQRKLLYFAGSLISTFAALKTKELAITIPFILTLCEFMFFDKITRRKMLYLSVYYILVLTVPLTLVLSNSKADGWNAILTANTYCNSNISRWDYLITQFRVITTYIRLLVFPVNQTLDYDYPLYTSFFSLPILASCAFLSAIAGGAVYAYYRSSTGSPYLRLASFGILWFFCTLSVESSIIPLDDLIFEHRLYLPSAGFFMAGVSLILIFSDLYIPRKKVVIVAVIPIILSLSTATYLRNRVWHDNIRLWSDVVKKSPNNPRGYANLGNAYFNTSPEISLIYFKKALELNPQYMIAALNIASVYSKRGNRHEAMRYYKMAITSLPDVSYPGIVKALIAMGSISFEDGNFEEAKRYFSMATLTPFAVHKSEAFYNLGLTQERLKEYRNAIASYERFLEIQIPETSYLIPKVKGKISIMRQSLQ